VNFKSANDASVAPPAQGLLRRLFLDGADDAVHRQRLRWLLQLLLAQDGSTTRICQAIAGKPLTLQLRSQQVTTDVPACVRAVLPGSQFIHRTTSLAAEGEIMMDNLVYVALDGVAEPLRSGLDSGAVPIGPLLESLWVRRMALGPEVTAQLCEQLWAEVGQADAPASRAYIITTPGGNLFVIAETFRRGMRIGYDEPVTPPAEAAPVRVCLAERGLR